MVLMLPVTDASDPPTVAGTIVTFEALVRRPFASTVNWPTWLLLPYVPPVTPVAASSGSPTTPLPSWRSIVLMLPVTVASDPAAVAGTMVTFEAELSRPFASTVICGTALVVPYVPALTPVVVNVGFG